MTTIAYRDGKIAADSLLTYITESGGARKFRCAKLFKKKVGTEQREVIIATAGESAPALVFVDWYGSGADIPETLLYHECDFTCLIIESDGKLYEADKFCRPDEVLEPFYAIGSGSKEALAAMHCGKSAAEAVEIAAKVDLYTGGEIRVMSLD